MDPIVIITVSTVATATVFSYLAFRTERQKLNNRINELVQAVDSLTDRFKAHRDFVDVKNANQDNHVHDQFYRLRHVFDLFDKLNEELDMNSSIDYYKSMVVDLENAKKAKRDANKPKGRKTKGG